MRRLTVTRPRTTYCFALLLSIWSATSGAIEAAPPVGYYRQPALYKNTIVFVSEGDLWKVRDTGGAATRLTSHSGIEGQPAISPDGQTLAFTADYEGSTELYTMPLAGGRPTRRTYDAARLGYVGWTRDGKLLFSTRIHSTLPNAQLVTMDISAADHAGTRTLVPLAQAADGEYDAAGMTLFFTRQSFQGSHTKRYRGGTAEQIWKFTTGQPEATLVTGDYPGTSKRPMCWSGRVYFLSDRDGTMNLWSMAEAGGDFKQHTKHAHYEAQSPSLHEGRIVYQHGADLHVYDIPADANRLVPITLDSDFDQTRERWVKKPVDYLTSFHISPDGESLALTARGRVFVVPHRSGGRIAEADRREGVRAREGRFFPDGKSLLALSDASGEVELWRLPVNGVGPGEQLTKDGDVLRNEPIISPDGKFIAHHDKNLRLFLYDVTKRENRKIDESTIDEFENLAWSPDSKWLAYVDRAKNNFRFVKLYSLAFGSTTAVTTDRYDSYSPAWSADGNWLYFLSDRNLRSVVDNPWGSYQPEPFLDRKTGVFQLALTTTERSPFAKPDELHPARRGEGRSLADRAARMVAEAKISLEGIQKRLAELPIPPGNYSSLIANDRALFWMSRTAGERNASLQSLAIGNERPEVKTLAASIDDFELAAKGQKIAYRRGDSLFIIDAASGTGGPPSGGGVAAEVPTAGSRQSPRGPSDRTEVDLSSWTMSFSPRDEWRQMYQEAWRLERDYFYDRKMHGVNWKQMRDLYAPLVDRVSSREELSDILAQMTAELAALHTFVRGGDVRQGADEIAPASLGAELRRDAAAGGWRVDRIFKSDPDMPRLASPLARPYVDVGVGDVILALDGQATLAAADFGALLRGKAGKEVLISVKPAAAGKPNRDVIVTPLINQAAENLRYHDWEYTRRLAVEEQGRGDLGYVHLRAMGGENFSEWAREFYPVFTRKGLIIDVRNNKGGNIDSWIISRLLRKPWFYWAPRAGEPPVWNMQYAFRGHVVVLCNEWTASDGEAFAEGVKRLGIGKVIGTRTWGGEIWLSMRNTLVDKGIASAAEMGVYGPEGTWLIEGHGVEPDIVVDNPPHATFKGEDAQLKAAIEYLHKRIAEKPVESPLIPPRPNKAKP